MDTNELSLLCLLVDAVIDAPDQFQKAADRVRREPKPSRAFLTAVDLVGSTLGKVKTSDKDERRKALVALSKKMAARDQVVAGAIEWAVANRRTMGAG